MIAVLFLNKRGFKQLEKKNENPVGVGPFRISLHLHPPDSSGMSQSIWCVPFNKILNACQVGLFNKSS